MPKEKPELSDAMRRKMSGKSHERNPIKGTKFTIAISSAKGGVGPRPEPFPLPPLPPGGVPQGLPPLC